MLTSLTWPGRVTTFCIRDCEPRSIKGRQKGDRTHAGGLSVFGGAAQHLG